MSWKEALTKVQTAIIAVIIVIAVIAIAYFLYSPLPTEEIPNEIRIGTVLELSGRGAEPARYHLMGLRIGVDWINDHGGIRFGDRNVAVKLIYYDDEGNREYSAKLTEKLISEDQIHILCLPTAPDAIMTMVPNAEKARIVSVGGSGSDVEYKQGYKYKIQPFAQGGPGLRSLRAIHAVDPTAKTIAYVAGSMMDPEGLEFKKLEDLAKELGMSIVFHQIFHSGLTDASPILREMVNSGADIWVIFAGPVDGMLFTSQIREFRMWTKWIVSSGIDRDEFAMMFGKAAVGYMQDTVYDDNTRWEDIAAREGKMFIGPTNDEIRNYWTQLGQTGRIRQEVGRGVVFATLAAKLIEMSQSLDAEKIIQTAVSIDGYTVCGPFKVNPQNPACHLTVGWPLVTQWVKQDNKLVYALIYPPEMAVAQPIPFPTWEERDQWPELTLAP